MDTPEQVVNLDEPIDQGGTAEPRKQRSQKRKRAKKQTNKKHSNELLLADTTKMMMSTAKAKVAKTTMQQQAAQPQASTLTHQPHTRSLSRSVSQLQLQLDATESADLLDDDLDEEDTEPQ
jgi:hypothetical protein